METYDQKMGQRLRELRKKHGYTQEELSRIAGVQPQDIEGYENGTCRLGTDMLLVLTKHYGIRLDSIFGALHNPNSFPELSAQHTRIMQSLERIITLSELLLLALDELSELGRPQ